MKLLLSLFLFAASLHAQLVVGTQKTYTATCSFLTGTVASSGPCTAALSWASSNVAVATIDAAGGVTALTPGTTNISASIGTIQSNIIVLVVSPPILVDVLLSAASPTIKVGTTTKLAATCKYSDTSVTSCTLPDKYGNSILFWMVKAGSSVADIDATGLVTGVAKGTAIFAGSSGLNNGTVMVTVQ